jgi:hypothetical protein
MDHDTVAAPASATGTGRCREFGITDAMIFVAGAALALSGGAQLLALLANMLGRLCVQAAALRGYLPGHWLAFWAGNHGHLRNVLWYGLQTAEISLVGMTLAFFAVRLRKPRPPLRALLRQPGTAASLAMVFGLFWGTGGLIVLFPDRVDSMTAAPIAVGGAVAASWVALALSRRWKSEPGWVDRVGRALGWIAIGTGLIGLVVFRI